MSLAVSKSSTFFLSLMRVRTFTSVSRHFSLHCLCISVATVIRLSADIFFYVSYYVHSLSNLSVSQHILWSTTTHVCSSVQTINLFPWYYIRIRLHWVPSTITVTFYAQAAATFIFVSLVWLYLYPDENDACWVAGGQLLVGLVPFHQRHLECPISVIQKKFSQTKPNHRSNIFEFKTKGISYEIECPGTAINV